MCALRLQVGDPGDHRLLLLLHARQHLALGVEGGALGGQVGAAVGQAAEHLALRAHRVLHQGDPGGELVRALRVEHDRQLTHADPAGLVGGTRDPPDELVAGSDVPKGGVDLRLGAVHLGRGDVELLAEDLVAGLRRDQLAVHAGHPGAGRWQLGLGVVQGAGRVPQRGGGLVQVVGELLHRRIDLVLLMLRVGDRRGQQPQAERRDHGEGQRRAGSHAGKCSGRSANRSISVSNRQGPG
jgi:hypothetical protein